ncbi:hypothetical protein AB0D46_25905 [Streptomyces sp. NPDC048383]|uniref:hypothetical protein n=1 Tax=Streptomyces sp. NPDC048383 TaxID=3155386 RepID=UPI00341A68DA
MSDGDQRTLDLLRRLDRMPGPHHMEFPDGFDYNRAEARAGKLSERLTREFGFPCPVSPAQDASSYFSMGIDAQATEAGGHLGIRLSNYGDLASITTPARGGLNDDLHGDLDEAVAEGAISQADRIRVETALSDLGYVLVQQRPLQRRYDGVHTDWVWAGEPTWWVRFFYYL